MTCAAVLAAADDTRITATQFRVLVLIAKGYAKRADMGAKIGKKVVTVARAIDALVKLGWVDRETIKGKPSRLSVNETRIIADVEARARENDTTVQNDTTAPNDTGTRIMDDTPSRIEADTPAKNDTGSRIKADTPEPEKRAPLPPPKPPYDNNSTPQELYPERVASSGEVARDPSLVDRVCKAVNSPYLDPNKSPGLVTTSAYVQRWCGMGLDLETEIVPIISAKCAALNGHGRAFGTFKYFDGMMLDAVAAKKSAQETPDVSARTPQRHSGNRGGGRESFAEFVNRQCADDQPLDLGRLDSHACK